MVRSGLTTVIRSSDCSTRERIRDGYAPHGDTLDWSIPDMSSVPRPCETFGYVSTEPVTVRAWSSRSEDSGNYAATAVSCSRRGRREQRELTRVELGDVADRGEKRVDDRRVELRPRAAQYLRTRLLGRHPLAVGPVGDHRL